VVVADFYMKNCYWCQKFQADWNRIVQDFTDSYEGNVVFYKIDGPDSPQITHFLHIESYPSFILWKPNSQGGGSIYQGRRAYEDMKEWIIMGANAANLTLKEGGPIKAAVPWSVADKTNSP
jgi:thioredoxin-like negative regulator of GroEL